MARKDRESLYLDCLEAWGAESQAIKAMEECGELIQALSKYFFSGRPENYEKHRANLAEELSDVSIMIEQMLLSEDLEQEFKDSREKKLIRIRGKLDGK